MVITAEARAAEAPLSGFEEAVLVDWERQDCQEARELLVQARRDHRGAEEAGLLHEGSPERQALTADRSLSGSGH